MNDETIVAVYDNPVHAETAADDLRAAGVPAHKISMHAAGGGMQGDVVTDPPKERGFWADLFGGEPDHDVDVYHRSVSNGSTVLSVQVAEADAGPVLYILNSHHPIDIDERAANYGLTQTAADVTGAQQTRAPVAAQTAATSADRARTDAAQTIQLSEEQLSVGKRVVNRGNTRIRRFVVETPVEEQVTLHEETVTVDRRPVTGRDAVVNPDFSDKTIEVQAFGEEAVVSKNARVVEEVTIGKQATDRTETIRETLRREDVEITKGADAAAVPLDATGARLKPVR